MKKLLSFLLLFLLGVGLQAQDVVLTTFDGDADEWETPNDDFAIDDIMDNGNNVAWSYGEANKTPNAILRSPEYSFSPDDSVGCIDFWYASLPLNSGDDPKSTLKLRVIVDGQTTYDCGSLDVLSSEGWKYIKVPFYILVNNGVVDFSDYCTLQFEIVHAATSNYEGVLIIDDFALRYRRDAYMISFDPNGGSGTMETEISDADGAYTAPYNYFDPPADDYTFAFWYTLDGNSTPYNIAEGDEVVVEEDMLWYAIWGKNYVVRYHSNNENNETSQEDAVQYFGYEILDDIFWWNHHTLTEWTTEPDGSGTVYQFNQQIDLPVDGQGQWITDTIDLYAQWEEEVLYVNITFDAMGGEGTDPAGQTVVLRQPYTLPQNPYTYEDHLFLGWSTSIFADEEDIYQPGQTITFTDEDNLDVTLYAQWHEIEKYNVYFYGNGGEGNDDIVEVEEGQAYVVPSCSFTYDRWHTFVEWNTEWDGEGMSYSPGETIHLAEDLTLYAIWYETPTVIVQFDLAEYPDVWDDDTVDAALPYTIPQAPSFTGYRFLGWLDVYADPEQTYQAGHTVNFDSTTEYFYLQAQWLEIAMATISFDANGGDGVMNDLTVVANGNFTMSQCGFQRDGYQFLYWSTDPVDGDIFEAGETYDLGESESVAFTLYAVWTPVEDPTIFHFEANGADGFMPNVTWPRNSTYTIPACTFTYFDGFEFANWNTAADGTGTSFLPGDQFTPTASSYTLYAQWVEHSATFFTIHFAANGGTGEMQDIQIEEGDYLDIYHVECSFSRTGYTFAGWALSPYGMPETSEIAVNSDMTFYALWQEDNTPQPGTFYTIHFEANGGTGTMQDLQIEEGEYLDIYHVTCSFTRLGYTFAGWSLSPFGFAETSEIAVTSNMTFYALWEVSDTPQPTTRQFTVSYDPNGGLGVMSAQIVDSGAYITLPTCTFTRDGYTFTSWSRDALGLASLAGQFQIQVLSDMTLYALWQQTSGEQVTIVFDANGGLGTMSPIIVNINEQIIIPSCSFVREGYHFVEWNTLADGNGMHLAPGNPLSLGRSTTITLYAIWAFGTTGIDDIATINFTVYPNPVVSQLHIDGIAVEHLDVLDLQGRTLISDEKTNTVDLSSLARGVYMLRIQYEGQVLLRKIVKK